MTTSTAAVLDELDTLIAERSILQHPFYRAWTAGVLTREDLAVYARVYYPHVAVFPRYLQCAITGTREDAPALAAIVKHTLADNLRDELSVPAPHGELWLRFAEAVGARREEVQATAIAAAASTAAGAAAATAAASTAAATSAAAQASAPLSTAATSVANAIETFTELCESGSARALATLYAYESQQPEVSREKIEGLKKRYGIADEQALAYFTVHAETDVAHRDGERHALAACLDAGATREEVLDSASQALDAYWHLLDAVSIECGRPSA